MELTEDWPLTRLQRLEAALRCRCAKISRILASGDSLSRVRLCHFESLEASCLWWLLESEPVYRRVAGSVPEAREIRVPIPLGDGRFTEPLPLWNLSAAPYPIPLLEADHQIVIVLRQWVEGNPDPTFGSQLRELQAWDYAVKACQRAVYSPGGWNREADPEEIALHLRLLGLPSTPGTVSFLLHCARPDRFPSVAGPTKGVLVTSFGLVPELSAWSCANHGEMVSQLTAHASWSNDELRRRALVLLHSHSQWWEKHPWAALPRMDGRKGRRRDEIAEMIDEYIPGDTDQRWRIYQAMKAPGEPSEKVKKRLTERLRRAGKLP